MAICPKTMTGCCDDLCYGGGCLKMPGVMPMTQCAGCGQLVSIDGMDELDECECDQQVNWDERYPDDYGPFVPDRPGILVNRGGHGGEYLE